MNAAPLRPSLAIKVDVCNRRALEQGVPRLLEIFAGAGVRASFFVAFGPDNSGRALLRIFKRGFLAKMIRTRAPRLYGVKTLLYGTLLPAPPVGEAFPQSLRAVEGAGHELGIHGWDHVGWQDRLSKLADSRVRELYARACDAFERSLGHRPKATAAPGWQCTPRSLAVEDEFGFDHASDCRGDLPFYPRTAARIHRCLQIPTTLPTSDELIGANAVAAGQLAEHYLAQLAPGSLQVLCVHAESEGLLYAPWFVDFLARARERQVIFRTLGEVAREFHGKAPVLDVEMRALPGRAGTVACSVAAPGFTAS